MNDSDRKIQFDADALVLDAISESIEIKQALRTCTGSITAIAERCATALENGNKLLLCGNGGSAADAQHLAAELLVRLDANRSRQALPAIALALDASALTACGNDFGFEFVFARMVEALGRAGDVLIAISTSGESANVLHALEKARAQNMQTIGLLGKGGGRALDLCDLAVVVPSATTCRIQEAHIVVGHIVMELIEEQLKSSGRPK